MKQFRNTPYFVTNTGLVYRQGSNKPQVNHKDLNKCPNHFITRKTDLRSTK